MKAPFSWTIKDFLPLKPLSVPRVEGGNVVVEIVDDDYQQGVNVMSFSVDGKLSLQKWEFPPTIMHHKEILSAI